MKKRVGKKLYTALRPRLVSPAIAPSQRGHGERSAAAGAGGGGAESNHPVESQDGVAEAPELPGTGTGHFWIYILANERLTTLYIGVTNSLSRRLWFHAHTERDSFAKRYHLTRLIYYENYDDPRDAIRRESQLKRWTRAKKVALIERVNPSFADLAEALFGREGVLESATGFFDCVRIRGLRSE